MEIRKVIQMNVVLAVHTHTLCTALDYVFYQIVKKYQHASHAVICMHVWFWISWLFKYAVRNSPALPPALSRCTLTLSLVLIELFRFKASFAMERGNSQKYLNCKNASSSKEGGKIQGNLSELETPPPPSSTLENPQHTAQKRQHIHSVSSALPANLPCPNLCNRIWHILQRIVGDEKKKSLIWGENHKMFKLPLRWTEIHRTNPGFWDNLTWVWLQTEV